MAGIKAQSFTCWSCIHTAKMGNSGWMLSARLFLLLIQIFHILLQCFINTMSEQELLKGFLATLKAFGMVLALVLRVSKKQIY
jgi:hypothetical protein